MNNLRRILSISLGGIVLFSTTCLAKTGTVNAPNGLVLRENASKSANPIMTISDKSSVEILEENEEWYKVKYNEYGGYLFAEYVNVDKEEEKAEDEETVTEEKKEETESNAQEVEDENNNQKQNVKADLNIYTIPSVTAKTIATVKKDEAVTINYELNNWINITYGKTTGWARKYFLNNENITAEKDTGNTEAEKTEVEEEKNPESNVTIINNKKGYVDVSTSANIREQASTSSNIINTLLKNTEVTIIAEEGDFYKMQYQDITGYISKSLISDKPVE